MSIQDVAALAKVSISTVSWGINNTAYHISDKKRKAVKKINSTFNSAAQQFGHCDKKLIGLIVLDIFDFYFREIAKVVSEQTSKLGYATFICNTERNTENELVFHDLLWQYRVRGILFADSGFSKKPGIGKKNN
jgi:LacI family transcriptional regulator